MIKQSQVGAGLNVSAVGDVHIQVGNVFIGHGGIYDHIEPSVGQTGIFSFGPHKAGWIPYIQLVVEGFVTGCTLVEQPHSEPAVKQLVIVRIAEHHSHSVSRWTAGLHDVVSEDSLRSTARVVRLGEESAAAFRRV